MLSKRNKSTIAPDPVRFHVAIMSRTASVLLIIRIAIIISLYAGVDLLTTRQNDEKHHQNHFKHRRGLPKNVYN